MYCITFQRTNQDRLRIGPFQSPSFASSMRCKKLEGSGYEIVTWPLVKLINRYQIGLTKRAGAEGCHKIDVHRMSMCSIEMNCKLLGALLAR